MPNPNPKQENLTPFKSPWRHNKTKTIRVPVYLADHLLDYARKLDKGEIASFSVTQESLQDILDQIENLSGKGALSKARSLARQAKQLIDQ